MTTIGRVVTPKLQIDWGGGFVDETANLLYCPRRVQIDRPRQRHHVPAWHRQQHDAHAAERQGRHDRAALFRAQHGGAIVRLPAGGGAYHRPVTFDVKIDSGSWVRVFTGVIKIPQETPPARDGSGKVTIECRTVDEKLLNTKISTSQAKFAQQQHGRRDGSRHYHAVARPLPGGMA